MSPNAAKYVINASCEVDGMIDKSDVIGAIFGQTEGLFNEEYDFRALLEKGRIGRIVVDLEVHDNRSMGKIMIPSNLDKAETALIASIVENVDRIGPYAAKINLDGIEDTRMEKVNKVIVRAKEILEDWEKTQDKVDVKEMLQSLLGKVREASVVQYGPEKLDAGPEINESESVIIVEGRADVLNLLRYGYRNTVSLGGAAERVPKTIVDLCRTKESTVFLDGDRGGDLILKRLVEVADIDFVARAPQGKEVEELTAKEIMKSLTAKVPVAQPLMPDRPEQAARSLQLAPMQEHRSVQEQKGAGKSKPQVPEKIVDYVRQLHGTLEAVVLDQSFNEVAKLSVKEMADRLHDMNGKNAYAVVFDGVISQRILDTAGDISIQYIVGNRVGNIVRKPAGVVTLTFEDVLA